MLRLAFVPIENSIEGAVNATVDSLVFEVDLLIQREVVLDIHLHLAARARDRSSSHHPGPVDPGRIGAVPALPRPAAPDR